MENQLLELFSESESKPKRKNNPELLRHSILIAAKNLMLQDGIANLSMQKVADAAGTSKGGLFHHFKNKDELILSVLELFIAQVNTAIMQHINEMGEVKGMFSKLSNKSFFGYEIHSGVTNLEGGDSLNMMQPINEAGELVPEGAQNVFGKYNVYGSYCHGIFDGDGIAITIVEALLNNCVWPVGLKNQ